MAEPTYGRTLASRLALAAVLIVATLGTASAENTETLAAHGATIYATYCQGCHGENGDGHGPAADMLIVKPRDFTKGVFKFRSTPTGELPTDDDLYRIITNGAYGTSMPAWPLLSERERRAVVAFIKTYYPDWQSEGPGQPIYIPSPPEFTGSQASIVRGRELYELLDCAKCHGDQGRGDGESANDLDPDIWGNRQRPFDFTSGPLRGGSRFEDIYRTFMTGVGGTAMPSFADIFAEVDGEYILEDDAWNLVSYVWSLRRSTQRTAQTPKE